MGLTFNTLTTLIKKYHKDDYEKLFGKEVKCLLCPRKCLLQDGERGDCRVRLNLDGTLYSLVYGKPCAFSLEPIEKAPLFHFMPGHARLCIATAGCNFNCKFCGLLPGGRNVSGKDHYSFGKPSPKKGIALTKNQRSRYQKYWSSLLKKPALSWFFFV